MTDIIGYTHNKLILENAFNINHMPHAWLLTGPKGVGKASLVENFIYTLLHLNKIEDLHAHPHFFQLKSEDATINVEAIRKLIDSLNLTSFNTQYRFCMIDAIDDLNTNASNALLKILEDPPEKTIFFLISHKPYTLIKTIKSRCIQLRFHYLSYEITKNIIESITPSILPYFDDLYYLLKGVPGQFLTLEKHQGLELFNDLKKLLAKKEPDFISFALLVQKIIDNSILYPVFKSLFISLQSQNIIDLIYKNKHISNTEYKKNEFISSIAQNFYKTEIIHLDKSLQFLESYSVFVNR